MTVSGISYSTIAHSTEDPLKVERAILTLLPESMRSAMQASIAEATGHHGNPIRVLSLEVRGKKDPPEAFGYLMRLIPMADRLMIRDQIMTFWDGRSTVFLRLDKQSCLSGQPRLSNSDDVIRVKISLIGGKHDPASVLDILDLA